MWRRFIYWALAVTFAYFVITRLTEIKQVLETFSQGRWWWLGIAVMLQLAASLAYTLLYREAFRATAVRSKYKELVLVYFASIFVNIVAPVSGAGGIALFADNASRHNQSSARAAMGALLAPAAIFASFTVILGIALFLLDSKGRLYTYELVAAAILFAIMAAITGIIFMGLKYPERLTKILNWLQRAGNKVAGFFNQKTRFDREWVTEHIEDFNDAAHTVIARPKTVFSLIMLALAIHALEILMLSSLWLAFQLPFSLSNILIGYTIATLFWVVSITPQGIGVVEAIVPLVLVSLGTDSAKATVVTLAFRGLSFWLPLAIGAVTVRRIKSFQNGN